MSREAAACVERLLSFTNEGLLALVDMKDDYES